MKPRLISYEEIVTAEYGTVIWLEFIWKNQPCLEPFLVDIEPTQKPVICNAREMIYNFNPDELRQKVKERITNPEITQFRFWLGKPTEEQCKNTKWK